MAALSLSDKKVKIGLFVLLLAVVAGGLVLLLPRLDFIWPEEVKTIPDAEKIIMQNGEQNGQSAPAKDSVDADDDDETGATGATGSTSDDLTNKPLPLLDLSEQNGSLSAAQKTGGNNSDASLLSSQPSKDGMGGPAGYDSVAWMKSRIKKLRLELSALEKELEMKMSMSAQSGSQPGSKPKIIVLEGNKAKVYETDYYNSTKAKPKAKPKKKWTKKKYKKSYKTSKVAKLKSELAVLRERVHKLEKRVDQLESMP